MLLLFKEWLNPVKPRLVVYDFDATVAQVPERPSSWHGSDWWGHPDSLSAPHYDGAVNDEVVASFKKDQSDPNTHVILLTGRRGIISHKVRGVLRQHGLYGKRMIGPTNTKVLDKYKQVIAAGEDELHPDEENGHEQYYSGDYMTEPDYPKTEKGKIDGTTLSHKFYVIKRLAPNRSIIEFWDDRADHIPHFIKLGQELLKQYGKEVGGKLESVILHRVYPPQYAGGQASISHIPIKHGMVY